MSLRREFGHRWQQKWFARADDDLNEEETE
jgi:hypothetical protein